MSKFPTNIGLQEPNLHNHCMNHNWFKRIQATDLYTVMCQLKPKKSEKLKKNRCKNLSIVHNSRKI